MVEPYKRLRLHNQSSISTHIDDLLLMHIRIISIAGPDLLQTHYSLTNAEMDGHDRKPSEDRPLNLKIEPTEVQAVASTVRTT